MAVMLSKVKRSEASQEALLLCAVSGFLMKSFGRAFAPRRAGILRFAQNDTADIDILNQAAVAMR
jgi:hypothetical protein